MMTYPIRGPFMGSYFSGQSPLVLLRLPGVILLQWEVEDQCVAANYNTIEDSYKAVVHTTCESVKLLIYFD